MTSVQNPGRPRVTLLKKGIAMIERLLIGIICVFICAFSWCGFLHMRLLRRLEEIHRKPEPKPSRCENCNKELALHHRMIIVNDHVFCTAQCANRFEFTPKPKIKGNVE